MASNAATCPVCHRGKLVPDAMCAECWEALSAHTQLECHDPRILISDVALWASERSWKFAHAEVEAAAGQLRRTFAGDPGPSGAATNRRGFRKRR